MMVGFLRVVGVVLILAGWVGGILLVASVDWDKYGIAQTVYKQLPGNEYSRAEYELQRSKVTVAVAGGVAAGFSGLATGLVFLGLARAIEIGEASQAILRELAGAARMRSENEGEPLPESQPAAVG